MSMQDQVEGESRTNMIYEMEKKLNANWFAKRLRKHDTYATLSTTQYWDWLTYIDVRSVIEE
jgi:hypothetical protein